MSPVVRMRRLSKAVFPAYVAVVFLYLFAPIIWIVVFSFNEPRGRRNISWNRFTWDNWAHPFSNKALTGAFWSSLQVAALAALVATIFGGLIALSLARYRFRGSGAVNLLLVLPLTTPEIVLGSSLFTLFFDREIGLGFATVVVAHVMFCISFVALTVKARIRGFDWTLEEAAADLGASPLMTFTKVTFPLILPGILAAAMLSFALSIDDYIITSFVAGDSFVTFPMRIFNQARTQTPPQINVLATIVLVVTVALILVGVLRGARRQQRLTG